MKEWIESLLLWGLAAVLVFWFVGAHNRLVRMRSLAVQAYGALDALVMRQIDYVQGQVSAQQQAQAQQQQQEQQEQQLPLAEMDPAPAQGTWSRAELGSMQAANAQLLAMLDATRARPLEPEAMAALRTALHVMLGAWERLHPESVIAFAADGTLSRPAPLQPVAGRLVSDEVLPLGWPEPTALIEIKRAEFNQAVTQYNAAISQFPAALLAWIFRWRRAAPLY